MRKCDKCGKDLGEPHYSVPTYEMKRRSSKAGEGVKGEWFADFALDRKVLCSKCFGLLKRWFSSGVRKVN
jgi:hypothetical protein